LDNRGSHFYLALYWAQALAQQTQDAALGAHFAPLAQALTAQEETITQELKAVQGKPADMGGYYYADLEKMQAIMRPSATFNAALSASLT
jgi:isocitrate dehydrogenase